MLQLRTRVAPMFKPTLQQAPKLTIQQKHFGDFVSESLGRCPKCKHLLDDKEIRAGFSEDPRDFRTTCPKCGEKFLAHLIIKDPVTDKKKEVEKIVFMCPAQTLSAMKKLLATRGKIGIAYLAKHNRQLYYNMVRHWGCYEKAYQACKADFLHK